jgi:hypothetical protein
MSAPQAICRRARQRSREMKRNRDAEARRASPRKSAPTQPTPDQPSGQPIDIGITQSVEVRPQPIRAADAPQQPVPPDWQSTASDLSPAMRRYVPPNYAIVPPQEPPVQPQPVTHAGSPIGAAQLGAGRLGAEFTVQPGQPQPVVPSALSRIETDYANLLLLARSKSWRETK